MILNELRGNIFSFVPKGYKLGHCIAADAGMGRGIAVDFVRFFPKIKQLRQQNLDVGTTYFIDPVLNIVTKRRSAGKPSYESMGAALESMRGLILQHNITHLAIPKIGCGLDRLSWPAVREMLHCILKDVEIEINVYIL